MTPCGVAKTDLVLQVGVHSQGAQDTHQGPPREAAAPAEEPEGLHHVG